MRTLIALAGAALATSTASAAFLGVEIREDKELTAAAAAVIPDARVFNFYAKMTTDSFGDQLLNVSLDLEINRTALDGSPKNQNAQVFQTPPPFGTGVGAPNSGFFDFEPTLEFDTFASIGLKSDPTGGSDQTAPDPDFSAFGFNPNGVFGGWFIAGFPPQGVPQFNSEKGEFEVFFMQMTITGLDADSVVNTPVDGVDDNSGFVLLGDVFVGSAFVFTQLGSNPENGVETFITFDKIPTPGAIALFGVAGLAASRRRR
jgi:hypothetical protein